jgi:hypothetical protein
MPMNAGGVRRDLKMSKHIFSTVLAVCLAVLLYHPGFGRDSQESRANPSTLNEYDLVLRGKMSQNRGARPIQIARMDNNGEILLACLEPKTTDEMISNGMKFLQSQLELLVDWDLLEYDRKNKTYKTTIHVYGVDKSFAIRQQVGTAVKQLEDTLNPDILLLKRHLEETENEKSLFAVLYAYVLHSYSMEQFGDEIYRKPQLSEEHPFWNGYAWAIYPVKKFKTAVTALPVEGNQLFVVSAAAVPRLDFRQIIAFVKDIAADNRVDNPEVKKSLSDFDLFDDRGNLTIPIFKSDWSAKLKNMAKKVYTQTTELAESIEMKDILDMETQAQAAMFLHYEIRYSYLDLLLEKGTIPAPIDFENAANNSLSDVKNLVFLMRPEK